jgi:thioredoxin 2
MGTMTINTESIILACPRCGQKNRVTTGRPGAVCGRCGAPLDPTVADTAASGGPGRPVEVTDATYASEVLGSPVPVLLDCWAAWCGPCRAVAPSIDRLATAYAGRAKVCKLDVDANPRTAEALGVRGIPALFFVAGGRVVDQLVGAQPFGVIEAKLTEVLRRASG